MKVKVDFVADAPLEGLFSHLFNVMEREQIKKFVNVSASSVYQTRGEPFVTIDPKINKSHFHTNWISDNEENSNITISFIKHQFAINSYTLQRRTGYADNFPLEWVLEATNNPISWTLIHHKIRGDELNSTIPVHWSCSKKDFYSKYRFTMIGDNDFTAEEYRHMFALGSIEFFGSLYETICTIHQHRCLVLQSVFYLVLLQCE